MEESEKRKERLKAIREAAAEDGDNNAEQKSIGGLLDHGLTNPLIESPSTSVGQDEPRPRFDYYTDPMAAFSANNEKSDLRPRVSQPCNTPPRPLNAGSPAYHAQGNYNSGKRLYRPRGVNAIPLGIRRETSLFCTPPGCGAGSPYQGSGSKSRCYRGSGKGGGRYKFYYDKSMVEDPWKALKPVIWKPRGNTRDSLKSWLPNSISVKKAKLGETPTKSTPRQSLAEYLAAAFNEAAAEDTLNNESGNKDFDA